MAHPTSTLGWTARSPRALPRIDAPRIAGAAAQQRLRPLVVLMIVRPLVAVAIFFAAAARGWWLVLPLAAWLTYGSALTAVHHLIHGSLGLSARARHLWLGVLAATVVESGHALQVTHLAHHRTSADHPDPEGWIENVSWRQLPVAALRFRYRLAWWGLHHAPRRRWIRAEIAVHALAHLVSLALLGIWPALWLYLTSIHVASFLFAVLAGKGPQTNWGRPVPSPFVRVRTRLGRILFFSHDLHLEHHVYPKVPLPRLRRLTPVLDEALGAVEVVDVKMAV